VIPTGLSLLGLTSIVLTKDLVALFPALVNRGVEGSTVAAIALFKAIPILSWMFPFAVLIGALVALGRLGADREILVLEASGVAAPRLVWPILAVAAGGTAIASALSMVAAPWGFRGEAHALAQIARERPWARLESGVIQEFGGWRLEAREVSPSGTDLAGVLLFMPDVGETLSAKGGRIEKQDSGAFEIRLSEGRVLPSGRRLSKLLRFDEMRAVLPEREEPLVDEAASALAQLPLAELYTRTESSVDAPERARAAREFQRRLAVPLSTLVFGFLAAPLFLARANFSRASGGILGMLVTIAYYALLQVGEGLAESGQLPVAAGVWLPNLVLTALGAILLVRSSRAGALGHAFDRPQRSARALRRERARAAAMATRRFALPRYVASRFIQLSGLGFAVIFGAYLAVDIMERLDWFVRYHAGGVEILRFYSARVWLLASRSLPMGLLVGTALTVSLLAAEGELMGMRACGISAARALRPAFALSILTAPLYFAFNNAVVPRSNALADWLKKTEIKRQVDLFGVGAAASVWFRAGSQVLEAAYFDPQQGVARDLTIYGLAGDGLAESRVDAAAARHIGNGVWLLDDAAEVKVEGDRIARSDPPAKYAQLGTAVDAEVDTMHLSVFGLGRQIGEFEADGVDATRLRVDYFARWAEPMACVLLPLAVLFFAVAGPPFPGPAQTLLVSALLGVSYILLTGVAASVGYGRSLPPALAVLAPIALYSAIASGLGFRLLRRS
jgi:LPS export ABC transporter permease LptG